MEPVYEVPVAKEHALKELYLMEPVYEVPVAKEHALKELYLMEPVYEVLDPEATVIFYGKRESTVML